MYKNARTKGGILNCGTRRVVPKATEPLSVRGRRREGEWSKWSERHREEEAGLRSQGGICFHATGDAVRVEKTDRNG